MDHHRSKDQLLLGQLKYQNDNSLVKRISQVLISLIVLLLIGLILYREIELVGVILVLIVFEWINMNKTHGVIEIWKTGDLYSLIIKEKDQLETKTIQSIRFNWSYVHIETFGTEGADVGGKSGHGNLIFLGMIVHCKNDETLLLGKELYPWSDLPSGWDYKVSFEDFEREYRVKKGLIKLKKDLSELGSDIVSRP